MSQPESAENHESDPLQAFFEESAAPQPAQPVRPVTPVEPADLIAAVPDPNLAKPTNSEGELQRRLERAERQVERALLDIATLKSDLATLVSAVEDNRKRLSRPAAVLANVVTLPPRKMSRLRTIAAIVLLATAGAAAWGLYAVASYEVPPAPRLESESSSAADVPRVVIAPPSNVSPPAARAAPTLAKTSGAVNPAPEPSRRAPYVGTLAIDADPAGDVFLNRNRVGRTPLRLENLRAGSHLIWIEREGYRRWTRVVAVASDRISRVSASLDPLSR